MSRNWVTPIGQQLACGEKSGLPERISSLRLRILSLAQGWRMGLLGSPMAKVGCRPVTRKSSLETCGCAGSCRTGPAPLAGGMNSRVYANHPTLGLGAKSGRDASSALAEPPKLAARQTAPARMPPVRFPACLHIGLSSSTQLINYSNIGATIRER